MNIKNICKLQEDFSPDLDNISLINTVNLAQQRVAGFGAIAPPPKLPRICSATSATRGRYTTYLEKKEEK